MVGMIKKEPADYVPKQALVLRRVYRGIQKGPAYRRPLLVFAVIEP